MHTNRICRNLSLRDGSDAVAALEQTACVNELSNREMIWGDAEGEVKGVCVSGDEIILLSNQVNSTKPHG